MPTAQEYSLLVGIIQKPSPAFIQDPLQFCIDPTIGGILEVYISSRRSWGRRWFYNQTSELQYGQIDGSMQQSVFYKLFNRIDGAIFNQVQELEPSRSYLQTLQIQFNRMDIVKRDTFEQWVVSKDPIFIIKDFNLNYWLIGETNGCKVQWNATTDNKRGLNGDSLTITCRERYPIRQMTQNFIDNNIVNPIRICDYNWTDFCALTWAEVCAIPW